MKCFLKVLYMYKYCLIIILHDSYISTLRLIT